MATPTTEDKDDLLMSCRYGDLEDVQHFVNQFGKEAISKVRDENENTVLHMAAGNGHEDVLDYLLSVVSTSLLSAQNNSGSAPLHWAVLNSHLSIVQKLVKFSGGPGADLIDIKNAAGRSPLAEAEIVGWEEGAKWLVEMMTIGPKQIEEDVEAEEDENVAEKDIQVEIKDADGQIARMTISGPQNANLQS